MAKRSTKPMKRYTQNSSGASSKFGQLIGETFAKKVDELVRDHLKAAHPEYALSSVRLELPGGTKRQMDGVITHADSVDPVVLFESKWLKDARHHNDKGAWILLLQQVMKEKPSIRGAVAILAGYWTEGVSVTFKREGAVHSIQVAKDAEVYSTLEAPINTQLAAQGRPPFRFDAVEIRKSLPRSWELTNALIDLHESGALSQIADQWFTFNRAEATEERVITGRDLLLGTLTQFLQPLPARTRLSGFEITLTVETGNLISERFADFEELRAFLDLYHDNPQAILDKITPRRNRPPQDE